MEAIAIHFDNNVYIWSLEKPLVLITVMQQTHVVKWSFCPPGAHRVVKASDSRVIGRKVGYHHSANGSVPERFSCSSSEYRLLHSSA